MAKQHLLNSGEKVCQKRPKLKLPKFEPSTPARSRLARRTVVGRDHTSLGDQTYINTAVVTAVLLSTTPPPLRAPTHVGGATEKSGRIEEGTLEKDKPNANIRGPNHHMFSDSRGPRRSRAHHWTSKPGAQSVHRYFQGFCDKPAQRSGPCARTRSKARCDHPPKPQGEELLQWTVQGFVAVMPDTAATAIANDPRVDFVEQDAYASVSRSLSINMSGDYRLWNLDRLDGGRAVWDGTTYWGDREYNYQTDGTGVYIYMIDTGVDRSHSEFSNGKVLDGVQFADDHYSAPAPCGAGAIVDERYSAAPHGTGTASVAGGVNVGVASGAYVVPIKVAACDGTIYVSWLCLGMDWIVGPYNSWRYDYYGNPTPGVVSCSVFYDAQTWAPYSTDIGPGAFGQAVQDVIRGCPLAQAPCQPNQRGLAVIASANNQGQADRACSQWPAQLSYNGLIDPNTGTYQVGYPDLRVITVGGTDEQDRIWNCLNSSDCIVTNPSPLTYDPNAMGSNYGRCVDIYAPAHNIKAAAMRGSTSYRYSMRDPAAINTNSGTSFSAPYVAGIAARILQSSPTLSPSQLWAVIQGTAQSGNGFLIAHMWPWD